MSKWKDVEGFEGYYAISEEGQVKSHGRFVKAKIGLMWLQGIIKVQRTMKGYLTIKLMKNRATTNFLVHRLVALAFVPNLDNKPFVNHIDGNKSNNNASNLEWVTQKENIIHAFASGLVRSRTGEKNSNSKLNIDMVTEIRRRYDSGDKNFIEMACTYKVSVYAIKRVAYRQSWVSDNKQLKK